MPSRATLLAGATLYALSIFLATAALGFVVAPLAGHATGLFHRETDARAFFSLLTLKAVPIAFGLSAAAGFSYERLLRLSLARRAAVGAATALLVWTASVAIAALSLG